MIKVEVIEKFSLKDFHKIKNIKRATIDEKGKLFVGDTFECDEEMAKYLLGSNPLNRAVVKVIEVEPVEGETEPTIDEIVEEPKEEPTEPKEDIENVKPLANEEDLNKIEKDINEHVKIKPKKNGKK